MKGLRFSVSMVLIVAVVMTIGVVNELRAEDKPIVLKYACVLEASHPTSQAVEVWAEKLSEMSNGRIQVELHHGGVLGTSTEVAEYVKQGVVAFSDISIAFFSTFNPKFDIFSLPYLFRDYEHMTTVLNSEFGDMIKNLLINDGLRGVAFLDSGSRSVYTVDKPISTPDDMKGLKIRVMSKIAVATMNALGANGVPIPWAEIPANLQAGVIDAAENNPPSIISGKHYEVCKIYSLTHHFRVPDFFIMSEKVYQELPDDLRKIVLESIETVLIPVQKEMFDKDVAKSMTALEKEYGMTIHEIPDLTPFIEETAPVRKEAAEQLGLSEWLEKIENM